MWNNKSIPLEICTATGCSVEGTLPLTPGHSRKHLPSLSPPEEMPAIAPNEAKRHGKATNVSFQTPFVSYQTPIPPIFTIFAPATKKMKNIVQPCKYHAYTMCRIT